jgi:hypothetical protein
VAGALVLIVLAVWIFTRTWWGHLPHVLVAKATGG